MSRTTTLQRRTKGLAFIIACCALLYAGIYAFTVYLFHASTLTGWVLLATVLVLAAAGIRRKLTMLPLGSMGLWIQVHLYLGVFAGMVYWLHVPWLIGRGGLEFTLSLLVLSVIGSGIYGFYITRIAPRRLAAVGQEVRYDKIPWTRARILARAEHLIGNLPESADRAVLADYYSLQLQRGFSNPPSLWYMLLPTSERRRARLQGLTELYRYLSPELKSVAGEIAALIRQRDDVDYHHALQLRLRTWRAVHALLTVWLIALMTAHVVLALRMLGD